MRLRFTIQRMMVAVAVVALMIGGELMRRRWSECRRMADRYATIASMARTELESLEFEVSDSLVRAERGDPWTFPTPGNWADHAAKTRPEAEARRRVVAWYSARSREYEHVARRPWLPVPPEEPPPNFVPFLR